MYLEVGGRREGREKKFHITFSRSCKSTMFTNMFAIGGNIRIPLYRGTKYEPLEVLSDSDKEVSSMETEPATFVNNIVRAKERASKRDLI